MKNSTSPAAEPDSFLYRYIFVALIVALLLICINFVMLYVSLFDLKEETGDLINRNLSLIEDARESNQEIIAFLEDQQFQGLENSPQTERIFILLSEHDKKLRALQDTTNLLFDSQYNYTAENSQSPIK